MEEGNIELSSCYSLFQSWAGRFDLELISPSMMLSPGLLLAILALVARPARGANDFVNFPSEFGLNTQTTFSWENVTGYIAGIRVAQANSEEGDDSWLLGMFGPLYFETEWHDIDTRLL